jgi:hypothetical protein
MNTQELVIKNRPNAINMVNKGSSAYIESVPPIVDILAVLHRKVIVDGCCFIRLVVFWLGYAKVSIYS